MATGNLGECVRVESTGSWWYLDVENSLYLRMPKEEKPRENGWGGPEAGLLQDLVWHEFQSWEITAHDGCLRIFTVPCPNGDVGIVSAPITTEERARQGLADPASPK